MPIRINGKYLRNQPEQISKNMVDIAALKKELEDKEYTIQDIDIVDNHLIITTYGGETIDAGEIFQSLPIAQYYFIPEAGGDFTIDRKFFGATRNGDCFQIEYMFEIEKTQAGTNKIELGTFYIPNSVIALLHTFTGNLLSQKAVVAATIDGDTTNNVVLNLEIEPVMGGLNIWLNGVDSLTLNSSYLVRIEETFLLGSNLID